MQTACARREARASSDPDDWEVLVRAAQRACAADATSPLDQPTPAVTIRAVARPEPGHVVYDGDAIRLPALARPFARLPRLCRCLHRDDLLRVGAAEVLAAGKLTARPLCL